MNKDQKQNTNEPKGNEGQILFMIGMGLLALWFSKNEVHIKSWIFQNTTTLVLAGLAGVFLIFKLIHWQIRRKNKKYFERAEHLRALHTEKNVMSYYSKNPNQKRGDY